MSVWCGRRELIAKFGYINYLFIFPTKELRNNLLTKCSFYIICQEKYRTRLGVH